MSSQARRYKVKPIKERGKGISHRFSPIMGEILRYTVRKRNKSISNHRPHSSGGNAFPHTPFRCSQPLRNIDVSHPPTILEVVPMCLSGVESLYQSIAPEGFPQSFQLFVGLFWSSKSYRSTFTDWMFFALFPNNGNVIEVQKPKTRPLYQDAIDSYYIYSTIHKNLSIIPIRGG